MARFQILYWHDIPVQVRAQDETGRASKPLPSRFQEAIDQAAMKLGYVGEDAYLDGYQWNQPQEMVGRPAEVAEKVVADLEAQHTEIDWRKTVISLMSSNAHQGGVSGGK